MAYVTESNVIFLVAEYHDLRRTCSVKTLIADARLDQITYSSIADHLHAYESNYFNSEMQSASGTCKQPFSGHDRLIGKVNNIHPDMLYTCDMRTKHGLVANKFPCFPSGCWNWVVVGWDKSMLAAYTNIHNHPTEVHIHSTLHTYVFSIAYSNVDDDDVNMAIWSVINSAITVSCARVALGVLFSYAIVHTFANVRIKAMRGRGRRPHTYLSLGCFWGRRISAFN